MSPLLSLCDSLLILLGEGSSLRKLEVRKGGLPPLSRDCAEVRQRPLCSGIFTRPRDRGEYAQNLTLTGRPRAIAPHPRECIIERKRRGHARVQVDGWKNNTPLPHIERDWK